MPQLRTDPDLTTLALGTDLTTLGLNLNSPEALWKTFASPWADGPGKPEPEFKVGGDGMMVVVGGKCVGASLVLPAVCSPCLLWLSSQPCLAPASWLLSARHV